MALQRTSSLLRELGNIKERRYTVARELRYAGIMHCMCRHDVRQ